MKVIGTDGHKLSGLHVLGDLIGSLLLAVAQNLLVGWLGEMMEFLIVVENAVRSGRFVACCWAGC